MILISLVGVSEDLVLPISKEEFHLKPESKDNNAHSPIVKPDQARPT